MAFKEYGRFDAVGLAELVRKKQVSAGELLDEAIARTAKIDPQINAVVVKHYDYAKKQIDQGLLDGPFTGVPFLLKDIDVLQGTVTTFVANVYRNNVADHTGTLTHRFLDSVVAIFGKSSSPEFGLMPTTESRLFGPTRNPWNLDHSSGGSSGGLRRPLPRASCRWRMPATVAARSGVLFRLAGARAGAALEGQTAGGMCVRCPPWF